MKKKLSIAAAAVFSAGLATASMTPAAEAAQTNSPVSVTLNNNTKLPQNYDPRALQRMLLMAGYKIGEIDGVVGRKTATAVKQMLVDYRTRFDDLYQGRAENLNRWQIYELAPKVYQRAAEVGFANVLTSPLEPQKIKEAPPANENAAPESMTDLPAAYDDKSFQRFLTMSGYDIGKIDGKLGDKTLKDGLKNFLVDHYEDFYDLYKGKPEDLSKSRLKEIAPLVYKRAAELGFSKFAGDEPAVKLEEQKPQEIKKVSNPADFGLSSQYDAKSFQRFLTMAGYDIGDIDGKLGDMTLKDGLKNFLIKHRDDFADLYKGKAEDLSKSALKDLAPKVYKRAVELDISQYIDESPVVVGGPVSPEAKAGLSIYGLPAIYDAHSFQRMMQMAGFDIGNIDGNIGSGTAETVRKMMAQYTADFGDLYDGRAADLSDDEVKALAPKVYERAGEVGLLNMQAEPERWTLYLRATGFSRKGGRHENQPMGQGEIIMRAPDGRELFMVYKDGKYNAMPLTQDEADDLIENGTRVVRPNFNTGGWGKSDRLALKANAWNPYDGSALPGLNGGTVYRLDTTSSTLNYRGNAITRSMGTLSGDKSWIKIYHIDNPVVKNRFGFGIHVDGDTNGSGRPNDGTAGCIGVREEYAYAFFQFMKEIDFAQRPSHFVTLPRVDVTPGPEKTPAFFMVPRRFLQGIFNP